MSVIITIAVVYSVLFAVTMFVFIRFGRNYHRMYGRSDELEKGLDEDIDREAEKVVKANKEREKQEKHGRTGKQGADSHTEGDRRDD